MEGIIQTAKAYYQRASEAEQKLVQEFFHKLDINGDGKVSLLELKKTVGSRISNEKIFNQIDENGDGELDFFEVLTVYYLVNKADLLSCKGCYCLLVGSYFSCLKCLEKGGNTYELCCACHLSSRIHHEHELLDHHSMLKVLRDRTSRGAGDAERSANAGKNKRKQEIEELREIAKSYHRVGSKEVQGLAWDFFTSMDTDGDGKVDRKEFLTFMTQQGYTHIHDIEFFDELDQDGNGTLDFFEVMVLYYIVKSGRPFCDGCKKVILGTFFTCVECFKTQTSFDLCRDCYGWNKCSHVHNGLSRLLDNFALLEATRNSDLAKAPGVSLSEICTTSSRSPIVPVTHSNVSIPWSTYYTNTVRPLQNYSSSILPPAYPAQSYSIAYVPPYPIQNYYVPQPYPTPNYPSAIVPSSNHNKFEKWKQAFRAFEMGLHLWHVSGILCTIM